MENIIIEEGYKPQNEITIVWVKYGSKPNELFLIHKILTTFYVLSKNYDIR